MSGAEEVLEDGRERLPPGQFLTSRFPVLTYGSTPDVELKGWNFRVFGHGLSEGIVWSMDDFLALGNHETMRDFHCVTTWSRYDNTWKGVPIGAVWEKIAPHLSEEVGAVMLHCTCGYTTNLLIEDFLAADNLFASHHDGAPLTADHGGPLRFVCHHLYAWKSAKWVNAVELLSVDERGFWERNGYHNRGDPWDEERYAYQETA
jgi:DMSO/TMAO reductase YedYZ molybdopterin-dependent catalytic subunit